MAKFTHYLVTRFNIQINGPGPEVIKSAARMPGWEFERTKLFETFCAPTVTGQTNQNFSWLIYCDTNTDQYIIDRVQRVTQSLSSVQMILVSNFEEMLEHLRLLLQKSMTPYVITTRLDNDDGLGINFVRDVQNHFIPEDQLILNFLGGVHYHVRKKILTAQRYYLNNSFTSLIEKTKPEGMITIMGFNHLHPLPSMKTINIKQKYAFWRTLHQQNTALRGNRGWPIHPNTINGHYHLNLSEIEISVPNMILFTLKRFPRALRQKIGYLIKRVWNQTFSHPT